jgi:hypothetical protein
MHIYMHTIDHSDHLNSEFLPPIPVGIYGMGVGRGGGGGG